VQADVDTFGGFLGIWRSDGQKCIAGIGILQYWEKYFTASSHGYCNTYCSNAGYCSKYFVAISRILSKSFCKGRPPIEHLEHFGAMTGGQESAIPQRRANLTLSAPALTFAFSLHTQRSWLSAQAPIQSTAFLKTCGSTLMSVMSMAWSPVKMAQRSNEQSIAVVLEIRRVLQYVLGGKLSRCNTYWKFLSFLQCPAMYFWPSLIWRVLLWGCHLRGATENDATW
jgi:hypothetical protein